MSTSSRVVKNTGFLYMRMGLVMIVQLYSTRLVLASLGEVDFGIFNVIGGSIAMMGFLNATLANATQRFMSYAEGKGDEQHKTKIFNISFILHLIIAIVTILLLLAIMPLLFDLFLNIPLERIWTAKIVYFTLIFSTVLTIINVPYDAVLNAHENMFYYAVLGVIESIIKLGIAFICVYSDGDKLLIYSILMALLPLLTLSIMKIYCHKHYKECRFELSKNWDKTVVKNIANFSGWNFLTAISYLFTVQGLSVVLNHYFGTALNAAQGIANQVNGQLSAFSGNMMKALNPVIVKRTASTKKGAVSEVTLSGSKFSAILVLLFAIPICIRMQYILSIWLEDVPRWAVIFCQLQLIQTVIVQITMPLATAIYGKGDIKYYAIWKSIMNFMPLVLSIIAFRFDGSPIWLYLSLIIFMGLGGDIVIVYYAERECNLSARSFLTDVVFRIVGISIVMISFGLAFNYILPLKNIATLLACGIVTTIGLVISLLAFGLTYSEKSIMKSLIAKVSNKILKRNI